MNKKFFTLAAGLLLTSAFSTAYAVAEYVGLAESKKGEFVEIKLETSAGKLLQIEDNNELKLANFVAVTDGESWRMLLISSGKSLL